MQAKNDTHMATRWLPPPFTANDYVTRIARTIRHASEAGLTAMIAILALAVVLDLVWTRVRRKAS